MPLQPLACPVRRSGTSPWSLLGGQGVPSHAHHPRAAQQGSANQPCSPLKLTMAPVSNQWETWEKPTMQHAVTAGDRQNSAPGSATPRAVSLRQLLPGNGADHRDMPRPSPAEWNVFTPVHLRFGHGWPLPHQQRVRLDGGRWESRDMPGPRLLLCCLRPEPRSATRRPRQPVPPLPGAANRVTQASPLV